jgi:hypothetical protein
MTTKFGKGLRRGEGLFLVVVGLAALLASGVSLYVARLSAPPIVASADVDEGPHIPLPAGPRKYR